jgi:hypothetical protein
LLSSTSPVIGAALEGSGVQARGGIEADPAGAGEVDLAPGVEVGEVFVRARRAIERLHIRDELNEIAGDEPCREPEMPQQLHEQPAGVAA